MKVELTEYIDVNEDGTFLYDSGSLKTEAGITMGFDYAKNKHFMCVNHGRKEDSTLTVTTVWFDSDKEMCSSLLPNSFVN